MPATNPNRMTLAEALRALYIDFEGRIAEPPVLLGIHRRGRGASPYVQQDVIDPVFERLVPRYLPLRDCIENVVRRAEHGDRRIVAWSNHEVDLVRALLADDPDDADLIQRFAARYVNARDFAEYWRNKVHGGDKPKPGALDAYRRLIGYPVPDDAGPGHVGDTIRDVRGHLERHGLPLTPAKQAHWDRLVEHNRFDCAGMRAVCLRAARELEA